MEHLCLNCNAVITDRPSVEGKRFTFCKGCRNNQEVVEFWGVAIAKTENEVAHD